MWYFFFCTMDHVNTCLFWELYVCCINLFFKTALEWDFITSVSKKIKSHKYVDGSFDIIVIATLLKQNFRGEIMYLSSLCLHFPMSAHFSSFWKSMSAVLNLFWPRVAQSQVIWSRATRIFSNITLIYRKLNFIYLISTYIKLRWTVCSIN